MRHLIPVLLTVCAGHAAADPFAIALLDAERNLAAQARIAALRSAEPDTVARLDGQLKLLELQLADPTRPETQRRKAESVLRLLQAVRAEPRTLDGQPELPHPTIAVGEAGRSCAQALPLDQGDARRVPIAAGESLWFRVQLPEAVNLGLSSRGSSVDAALSVHADCRTVDQPPVASADDNYGLQADLVVPAARQSYWMVRYENLSAVGGDAVLRATNSGILQGTVRTADNQQVPGNPPRINLFRRESNFWSFQGGYSVSEGAFSFPVGSAGVYGVRTERQAQSPYIDQAFDLIDCAGSPFSLDACNGGNVTQIPLSGGEIRDVAFRLRRGIAVTGTVRDSLGQAISNATVELRLDSGPGSQTTTDPSGRYRLDGIPAGVARLRVSASRYRSVMYNNIDCTEFCNFPSGASPLPVSYGSSPTVDFVMQAAPSLAVTTSLSNDQISTLNALITLSLLRPNGTLVTQQDFSSFGFPVIFSGLMPGEYLLRLQSSSLIPRLYPDVECADDCIAELAQAQRIVIPDSPDMVQMSFQARRYPMISGVLRDVQSGLAIGSQSAASTVELLRLGGSTIQSFAPNSQGEYFMRGVAPGSYIVRARHTFYQSQVHNGFDCELPLSQCPEFTTIMVSRTGQDQRVDFSLRSLGRVMLTANHPGQGSLSLAVFSPNGQQNSDFFLSSTPTQGVLVNGIPLGQRVFGLRSFSAIPQLFNNVDCPSAPDFSFTGCPFALATPLSIQSGQTQPISFNLRPTNSRRVVVRDAVNATPLAGVGLDLWDLSGLRIAGFVTGADGSAWIQNPSSSLARDYSLSTDNRRGYLDQVHAGISCPNGSAFLGLCSLSGATPISLPAPDNNQPTIEILLQRETPLFCTGFEPAH
ncbi:MAG: carboxypeptidase-like regulatory domain-containing protein [Xanthomonadales bacterium]|jgi:hypothetical protein|nr:carboxypeptidase-like regulatory domain-containing protein [Xanthomonadales bacterium]